MQSSDGHLSAALAAGGQHRLQVSWVLLPGERRAGAAHAHTKVIVFCPRQHTTLTVCPVEPAQNNRAVVILISRANSILY